MKCRLLCISTSFRVLRSPKSWSKPFFQWKSYEMKKKVEDQLKKGFDQLLGARSTRKLVEIHNSRQSLLHGSKTKMNKNLNSNNVDWMRLDIYFIHCCLHHIIQYMHLNRYSDLNASFLIKKRSKLKRNKTQSGKGVVNPCVTLLWLW